MNYVLIKNGKVIQKQPYHQDGFIEAPDFVIAGFIYDTETSTFTSPPAPPEPIPTSITPRQARLELLNEGLLSKVDDAISSLDSPDKERAAIEWEFAENIDRDSPWINNIGEALGLTQEQIDDMFIAAAQI